MIKLAIFHHCWWVGLRQKNPEPFPDTKVKGSSWKLYSDNFGFGETTGYFGDYLFRGDRQYDQEKYNLSKKYPEASLVPAKKSLKAGWLWPRWKCLAAEQFQSVRAAQASGGAIRDTVWAVYSGCSLPLSLSLYTTIYIYIYIYTYNIYISTYTICIYIYVYMYICLKKSKFIRTRIFIFVYYIHIYVNIILIIYI